MMSCSKYWIAPSRCIVWEPLSASPFKLRLCRILSLGEVSIKRAWLDWDIVCRQSSLAMTHAPLLSAWKCSHKKTFFPLTHVMAGGYWTLNAYSPMVCVKLGILKLHPLLLLPLQPLQIACSIYNSCWSFQRHETKASANTTPLECAAPTRLPGSRDSRESNWWLRKDRFKQKDSIVSRTFIAWVWVAVGSPKIWNRFILRMWGFNQSLDSIPQNGMNMDDQACWLNLVVNLVNSFNFWPPNPSLWPFQEWAGRIDPSPAPFISQNSTCIWMYLILFI